MRVDYFESIRTSLARAEAFHQKPDDFTAYLYAFIAFNNLYRWLGGFNGADGPAIQAAMKCLPDAEIESFYTDAYVETLRKLNDRESTQVQGRQGVLNIQKYLRGDDLDAGLIARIGNIADSRASSEQKRDTLIHLATDLLYTMRNNQFHATKGSVVDALVLESGVTLLLPITQALLRIAEGGEIS